jgi:5'-methylthioadenosine phosphorylase
MRKDVSLEGNHLLIMRQAICPHMRTYLLQAASARPLGRIFKRGVYVTTDGRHFESPAEIAMFTGHGDIVGQSLCPEVYLAREIGACFAGLYTVVNYGEGVVTEWQHSELSRIFHEDAEKIAHIILDAIKVMDDEQTCGCADLRKPTLLTEIYGKME